jgi:hypothetical protein
MGDWKLITAMLPLNADGNAICFPEVTRKIKHITAGAKPAGLAGCRALWRTGFRLKMTYLGISAQISHFIIKCAINRNRGLAAC